MHGEALKFACVGVCQLSHILCSINFSENRTVYTAEPGRQHDNMAHAHCMLDN